MKKFILGLFVGVAVTASGSVFADDIISRVDAYINPSIPVTLDGKTLQLDKPVAIIDGSSYLPLKTLGSAIGKEVSWNDTTKSIELKSLTDNAIPTKDTKTQPSSAELPDNTSLCDGTCFVNQNGTKYIKLRYITNLQMKKEYHFSFDSITKTYSIKFNDDPSGDNTKDKVILSDIPTKVFEGSSYTEYDFYISKILPLIK